MEQSTTNDLILSTQREYSQQRLEAIKKEIGQIEAVKTHGGFCIYATGSYGRLEATTHSDLDLFMVQGSGNKPLSKIEQTLLKADLIRACRKLKFPEFSGDGEYLVVHEIEQVLQQLGSPADDATNLFTARMLLLLESKPLFNEDLYDKSITQVIESYFRDFQKHEGDFHPTFLINDILRYWKTLCLNYEHKRNTAPDDPEKQRKARAKNFKLKFSRLWTCFSLVIPLAHCKPTRESVFDLVKKSPHERLADLANKSNQHATFAKIVASHAEFMQVTNRSAKDLQEYLSNENNREHATRQASEFGDSLFALLKAVVPEQELRYLFM